MPNYRVPGSRSTAPLTSVMQKSDFLGVAAKPHVSTRVDAARGMGDTSDAPGTDHDDVVKIMLDDGIELWTRVDRAQQDYGGANASRGSDANLIVPRVLPIGSASRGVGDWVVKGIDLFKIDLRDLFKEKITDFAARKVVLELEKRFEAKLALGGPGLYRFGQDAKPKPVKDLKKEMAGGPSLIFIHGTASCSEAGFGKFKDHPAWKELFERYNDRVFAFEHRTLSASPIENALALAKDLPTGAEIDLISHSRGGLVAELLCRSARVDANGLAATPFDDTDKLIFRMTREENSAEMSKAERKAELDGLDTLNDEFAKKAFKLRHLVRAGCPARGTTLASKRLDTYLSLIVNGMKLIPGLSTSLVFEFTMGLLLAVAKLRTDPEEVPGLEAQMPESPLIRMLNRPDVTLSNRLSVISGDIQGGGVWGRLKVLATDLFYLEDHDLVVNTSAMYGGAKRPAGAYLFDKGTEVNHFSYFGNKKTAKGIADVLNPDIADPDGFKPIEEIVSRAKRSRAAPAAVKRAGPSPVVYVLPGIMGSQLDRDKRLIWLNPVRIAFGDIDKIAWGEPKVTAAGLFDDYYGDLVDYLGRTHEAIAFDYDWRKPLIEESKRLAEAVDKKMRETSQPMRFVGHSMGGLVVRAMAASNPKLWERIMLNPGARFVMLGTPNMGAFSTVGLLMGRDKTIKQLEALDFSHNMKEILSIVSRFPGGLELLPRDKNAELYEFDIWQKIRKYESKAAWADGAKTRLAEADKIWRTLEATPLTGNLAYVAGASNDLTPSAIRFEPEKNKVTILGTRRGDGRVTYATGIPPGVPAWYAEAAHGDLARHENSFDAYHDILSTGKTTRLPDKPKALARDAAVAELEEVREPQVEIFPDARGFADAVMGAGPAPRAEGTEGIKVKVRVVHGNLAFAHHPVTVGHYDGDTIRGAELALDFHLDGRLNRKRSLGLYPGKPETAEVILDEGSKPSGALIIGLGAFGELTPGNLRRSYAYGLRKYADIKIDGTPDATELKLSTLLIGHRESGITLRDAIASMMQGLIDAKIALKHTEGFEKIEIAELEIIELYEDTAIAALQMLSGLSRDKRVSDHIDIDLKLGSVEGKRRRIAASDESGWARKIQIRGKTESGLKGSMKFTVLDGSARAVEVSLATQTTLIDPYLRSLTGNTATNKTVSHTLFELLMPKEFKRHAEEDRDVELILDEVSAAYPWELLDDRFGSKEAPMAVRSSCIRRFVDTNSGFRASLSRERKAVVIGDSVSDPAMFAPLEGAQKEAHAVTEILESGSEPFEVTSIVQGSCAGITNAILTTSSRVMHIAAHGVFEMPRTAPDGTKDTVTGIVLGDGAYFTAAEVGQIRPFPELVFLNCCHLGNMAQVTDAGAKAWNERHRLASNLALQFILTGAKAVVAAGWAVNDNVAVVFAQEFYAHMLAGEAFSWAVKAARKAAYDSDPNCNTWGAYQCYGDPDYRLVSRQAHVPGRERTLYSQSEAAIELENFAAEASTGAAERLEATRGRIGGLLDLIKPWEGKSAVQEALAIAYAKVDQLDQAVAAYEKALSGSDSASSLKVIEQLANVRAKIATAKLRGKEGKERENVKREVLRGLKAAVRQIKGLKTAIVKSGLKEADTDTVERHGLVASALKRIGAAESGAKRVKALVDAAEAYRMAYAIALKPGSKESAYWPGLNVLLLEALANLNRPPGKRQALGDEQAAMLKYCRDQAEAEDRDSPNFWALAARFDAFIVEALWNGKLSGRTEEAVRLFKLAWRRGGSHLQLGTVREQLDFIHDCLQGVDDWLPEENLRHHIETIRAEVDAAAKR